jgi:hypothetical protein
LNPLGGEVSMAAYNPGLQARCLVEKMAESEKMVVEAIFTLTEKLVTLEKIDSYGGELSQVQTKVQSISLVQQEQIQVAKSLKLQGGGPTTS